MEWIIVKTVPMTFVYYDFIFILLIYCLDINTHSLTFPYLVRIFSSFF